MLNKYMKTEADEPTQKLSSDASTMVVNKFEIDGVAGKGTFGTVYIGHARGTGDKVAIKKVLQDKRYKNRELEILKVLKNDNVL
jgi:serine/threonine-protein kinase MDS1/RIM11